MTAPETPLTTSFASDARDWLDEACADAQLPPMRSIVERARAHGDVPEALAAAGELDDATQDDLDAAVSFGVLDDFVDDARALFDEEAEAAEPRAPHDEPGTTKRATALWVAAAAIVLVPLLAMAGQLGYRMLRDPASTYSSASDLSEPDAPRAHSTLDPPPSNAPRSPRSDETSNAVVEPDPELTAETETEAGSTGADESRPHRRRTPKLSKAERLRELDTRARAAWKAGNLREAQKLFDRLVKTGGRSRLADLAYGDLFALARQLGEPNTLKRYWRRYAKRFPSGQYIDDARAGLCRIAPADQQRHCWQRYIDDRPRGTYRRHARDVLAKPE